MTWRIEMLSSAFRGRTQLALQGAFGLADGKTHQGKSGTIREFMAEKKWLFWSPEDIKQKVTAPAERGYENDRAIITAKIRMR